jgi:predicted ATPase/DNA-binding winged helix-turn-helix (wHTH) protein
MATPERTQGPPTISFGAFALSLTERRLSKDGKPIELGGRAFEILVALIERAGQFVGKTELMDIVWPDTTVEEGSLRFHIACLRKALGEGESDTKFVTTAYGGGYCFVAPVTRSDTVAEPALDEASPRAPHRLPLYLSRLIGRDELLQDVTAQVREKRFVTIVGPGGIGKTMLAVAIGRLLLADFRGEVVFLDLATIRDPLLVPGVVASSLGLMQSRDPTAGLIAYLRDRRTLLILDSCEHVIDQAALLAERLFQGGSQTYILATSREALRAQGEHLRKLPPLNFPPAGRDLDARQVLRFPAVQLLVERVAASGNSFEFDGQNSLLAAEICRTLDGIPLAIELAAGSIGAFGLRETVARLNSRFELLWEGRRTAPPRQQTLSATLDWSYHLLQDVEQTVLRRLSVFSGNFSLEAAQSVAVGGKIGEHQVVSAAADLVSKSLVAVDLSEGAPWYRLLDTTRTYARNKLIDSEEAERTASQHAAYFLELLVRANAAPPSARDGKVLSNFGVHLGNIRAALEWGFHGPDSIQLGMRLAAASGHLFMELSLLTECRGWTERAIGMLDETTRGTHLEMELQAAFGFSAMHIEGNSKRAELALKRSLALAGMAGDLRYELRLLSRLHLYHSRVGEFRTALEYAGRCEPVARKIADPLALAEAHTVMGASRLFEGDSAAARRHFDAALIELPVSSQIDVFHFGALDFRTRVRIALTQALWLQGLPAQSIAIAQDMVEEARTVNHPVTACIVLVLASRVFLWSRNLGNAEQCANRMTETADQHFLLPYQAVARAVKGELQVRRGEPEAGVVQLRAALGTLHTIRYELQTTSFMMAVAEGLAMMGQHDAAIAAADETIAAIERNGDLFILPEVLRVKGSILASAHEAERAEQCFLSAFDLARAQQAPAWQLRAATSLARLRAGEGGGEKARAVLAPIYDRFTEGFDSADLVAARKLLRELG